MPRSRKRCARPTSAWAWRRPSVSVRRSRRRSPSTWTTRASSSRRWKRKATIEAAARGRPADRAVRQLARAADQQHDRRGLEGRLVGHPRRDPAGRERIKIRFRKDGALRTHLELPHSYRNALIARIKIMCDLDISERRKPRTARSISPSSRRSTSSSCASRRSRRTTDSRDVVMRLLASAKPMPLDGIGLSETNLARFKRAMERPYGMVLCVGPTGSGKTTTLHSALGFINVPERKIWTAEDPIEITSPGCARCRSTRNRLDLRQGAARLPARRPGRDHDGGSATPRPRRWRSRPRSPATWCCRRCTNSAPETVTRLLDMGMDPFNFADSLLAVLARRLVRRLCTHCRIERPATEQDRRTARRLPAGLSARRPAGDTRRAARGLDQRFGRDGRLLHYERAATTARAPASAVAPASTS